MQKLLTNIILTYNKYSLTFLNVQNQNTYCLKIYFKKDRDNL